VVILHDLLSLTIAAVIRDVFMEKHWKAVISRSVCDYFFDSQKKSSDGIPPPVIATPHHYLISIHRCNVFLVAVCMSEGKETLYRV
jgi:AP-3 complex subunit mu